MTNHTSYITHSMPRSVVANSVAWIAASTMLFGCAVDAADLSGGANNSDEHDDFFDGANNPGESDDSSDTGLDAGTEGVTPAIVEWTDVHDVQVIDGPNRVEVRARDVKGQVIGLIVLEEFGTRIVASSKYADGGFAVEVYADMGAQSFSVLYQTLGDDVLTARAAAIEDRIDHGSAPSGKWLACGVSAVLTVPACIGPLALISCIPTTIVAGCKCTKAALDLPNEKAGLCENI